jgi:UDP-glucose 4-epimerase
MKVLVTGGAGYIGAQLVYELSKNAAIDEIIVYDNLNRNNYNLFISSSNKIPSGKVRFVMGDILDSRKLRKAMEGVDLVYHAAAKVVNPYEQQDSHIFEQVNHWGTAEVVYAAEEEESVQSLVYLSSTSVYGSSGKEKQLTEDASVNPKTFYAISKMRGEEQVRRLMEKKKAIILRCGNVYGYSPAIRFDSLINRFLFDSNFNNRVQIHGSGKQVRSYISLDKIIKTLVAISEDKIPSGIYNLSDTNTSVLDLLDIFKEIYPSLEFIFINQHLELKNLAIDPRSKLTDHLSFEERKLKDEVIEIKEKSFAF